MAVAPILLQGQIRESAWGNQARRMDGNLGQPSAEPHSHIACAVHDSASSVVVHHEQELSNDEVVDAAAVRPSGGRRGGGYTSRSRRSPFAIEDKCRDVNTES